MSEINGSFHTKMKFSRLVYFEVTWLAAVEGNKPIQANTNPKRLAAGPRLPLEICLVEL